MALERGSINYVEFAKIVDEHPSYCSQILAEAAKLDPRVVYRKGVLYSKPAYLKKLEAEFVERRLRR